MPADIDHRKILLAYLRHILNAEGFDYMRYRGDFPTLTDAEFKELQAVVIEAGDP